MSHSAASRVRHLILVCTICFRHVSKYIKYQLAFVAQLDAPPASDKEAVGSIPARLGNILLQLFSSADSRRAVVSFWQKNVHNTG